MPFITQGKTNWKFLVIVIILAIIVGAGALWCSSRPEKPYQPAGVKKSETANWEIYRNADYGFEVKYPSEWIIMEENTESIIFANKKEVEIQKEKQAGEIRCSVGIWLYGNDKGLALYDWAIDKWGEPEKREAGKISEVKINDLEGIKYEFISMGTETNVLFSKDNKVIDIQTTFDGCDNINTIFNQILSTFNFIEPKAEIASWPTYRNEEYGFEFKYPPIPLGCEQCKISENSDGFNVNTTNFGIKDSGGLNLSDFVNKEMEGFTIEKKEEMIIGGENGIAIDYRFGGTNRFGSTAFVEKDNKVFVFSFTAGGFCCNPNSDKIYESEVYSAMLSTFRFLD